MNENITYFQTVETRPSSYNNGQPNGGIQYEQQQVEFHPTSVGQFHTTSANQFHSGNTSFITTGPVTTAELATLGDERIILQPHQRMIAINPVTGQQSQIQVVQMQTSGVPSSSQPQQILITTQPTTNSHSIEQDENRRVTFTEYFVEPHQPQMSIASSAGYQQHQGVPNMKMPRNKQFGAPNGERSEREQTKRAKQAEAARLRYHRLDDVQKKELNLRRTLAQKRKRQREREMAELEAILRQTNDIVDDPEVTEQLREKKMRARWADQARKRYNRLDPEERRTHNEKRRLRQMTAKNDKGEVIRDEDTLREKLKDKNAKKAEAARQRYHRMSQQEKKIYNQRRTEAFRKRRVEEEQLLATPIGQISGDALERAQQIVVRNARRAEAARLRYQRMSNDQRKQYNQKRYTPKRKRDDQPGPSTANAPKSRQKDDEFDALSTLEKEVLKRTQQAQQTLMRQRMNQPQQQVYPPNTSGMIQTPPNIVFSSASGSNTTVGAHLIQQQQQVQQTTQQIQFYQ